MSLHFINDHAPKNPSTDTNAPPPPPPQPVIPEVVGKDFFFQFPFWSYDDLNKVNLIYLICYYQFKSNLDSFILEEEEEWPESFEELPYIKNWSWLDFLPGKVLQV